MDNEENGKWVKFDDIGREMDFINSLWPEVEKYYLHNEVIAWALQAMKEDPELSISEAFLIGYNEWIK